MMRAPTSRTPRDDLGAHMSIAGGLPLAVERGVRTGCSTIQIFQKNQRQWAARPLDGGEARAFRSAVRDAPIRPVFAHASYLVNLAAAGAQRAQAIDAFTDELERAEALGLAFVVIHPGSHLGDGVDAGIARVVAALDVALARTAGSRVRVALENTAGAGGTLGRTFGELAAMIRGAAQPARLGVCIDTCHLFASGYDIRSDDGYERAIAECARTVGLRRVLAFHLNDARAGLGSNLDRHEHIGRGHLGLAPFRRLLTERSTLPPRPQGAGDAEGPRAGSRPGEPRDAQASETPLRRLRTPLRRLRTPLRPLRDATPAPPGARPRRRQRDVVTPIRRQSVRTGQVEQRGEIGAQTFCPKLTSRSL
jgi:deoxyribonuclease-4